MTSEQQDLGENGESSSSTSQPNPAPQDRDIPRLQTISSTIFVPLDKSLLEPFDAPRDKIDRLKLTLERTEKYSDDVRRNLLFIFVRERDRIMQQARRQEAAASPEELVSTDTITHQEADAMIQGMLAPPVPGRDYTVVHNVRPAPSSSEWATTWKSQAVEELLMTIERVIDNLNGFNGMMVGVHQRYHQAIEQEEATQQRMSSNQS